ncbi:MAG TPA: DUF2460 domain-containing protein, partial [Pyrinomonadaceae bacterium]
MAFDQVLFPLKLVSQGGAIRFKTRINVTDSGRETRNVDWDDPLLTFNAAGGVKTIIDLDQLANFFYGAKGMARGFLCKDFKDWRGINVGLAQGPWSQFELQVIKVYGHAGNSHLRELSKIKQGTFVLRKNGVALVEGIHYAIQWSNGYSMTGLLQNLGGGLDLAVGQVLTADYEFAVPVRFATDELDTDLFVFKEDNTGL